jgi:nitronate monooxygenase
LACEESGASPAYRELLFDDARKDTVLTKAFTGRLARSIRNRFVDEMKPVEGELLDYPFQGWFSGTLKPAVIAAGRTDLISLWASQSAPLIRFRSARSFFDTLIREAAIWVRMI